MANALAALRRALRRPRRHAGLERLPPPGAVLRGLRLGRGAAHAQPAPASRPDRLDRRPCRRPGAVLRPDLPAAGRGDRRARQDDQGLRRDDRPRAHAGQHQDPEPAVLRGPARRRTRTTSTGRRSTRTPPRRCATPPAPPATPRARSTATARRCCTPTPRRCPMRSNCSARDAILPVVPMFHVNAWGLPYVACMVGAKLVFPGPWLDGKSLYELFEAEGVTMSAGVPTVWQGLLAHVEANGLKFTHHAPHGDRRLGLPAGDDARVPGPLRRAGAARLGHDRDEPARHGLHAQAAAAGGSPPSAPRAAGQAGPRGVRRRHEDRRRRRQGAAAGRQGRRATCWCAARGSSPTTSRARAAIRWSTAGSPPATSPPSTPTASCRSPTAARTSSSPAASGSARSTWRTSPWPTPRWRWRRASAPGIRSGTSGRCWWW